MPKGPRNCALLASASLSRPRLKSEKMAKESRAKLSMMTNESKERDMRPPVVASVQGRLDSRAETGLSTARPPNSVEAIPIGTICSAW